MDCREAIEYIHSLERFGIQPGLERIGELCRLLGSPQNDCRFIHAAGTNGKGSTCTMIASALMQSGYRTGLYTSPYVTDFRERIMYCGEMIEPEELALCTAKVRETAEQNGIAITEFEAVTAVAFLYYSRKKCDWVVLETGLGGRFDATNVIPAPAAAVLTSISLDHMNILGNTVEAIAGEKCGIIKKGSKVVSYPLQKNEALSVIKETCLRENTPLIIPDPEQVSIVSSAFDGTAVKYGNLEFTLRLPGEHMVYNAVTAVEALRACGADITDEDIARGISSVQMPARTEILGTSPAVILDGGHNEDCAVALKKYIDTYFPSKKIIMVCALMRDKDCETYLRLLAPYASRFIATRVSGMARCLPAEELCAKAKKYCSACTAVPSPAEAAECALRLAGKNDAVIICGSFYLAGEVRDGIKRRLSGE